MLEDLTMEKKNRSLQPSTKGSGTDSKKTPDGQNGKQFPRGNRKREPTGSSNSVVKNETRRPPPQKHQIFDKRPKPRGFNGGRRENSQITGAALDDEEIEVLFTERNKKQNLTHLLNFHYEPRRVAGERSHVEHRQNYSTKSLMSTHVHKYNKEQFLQANCQFVVSADGDYGCNLGDPDLLVDWQFVELIRVGSNETITCPICLYPPTAAKITRCGHIYCWMCILHYLALTDKTWRKCPICYEAIHNKDLKSVECVERNSYTVGKNITLQLMKREKGSLIAVPVNEFPARSNLPILDLSEKNLVTVYSKLLLAQRSDIDEIINKEKSQLEEQLKEFKGQPELCFIEQALENLNQRILSLGNKVTSASEAQPVDVQTENSKEGNSVSEPAYDYFENQPLSNEQRQSESIDEMGAADKWDEKIKNTNQSESVGSEYNNELTVADLEFENPTSAQPTKFFYFYQAIDGQEIYLHSINLRMLEKSYGSLEHCPVTIQGKIVEKEVGSMTRELRKRLKYLQHVPITCQFEVVELNLHMPLILKEVLEEFHEQLETRKKRRQRQARAERKREKMIAETVMSQFGRGPDPNLRIESHYHFPGCGENDFPRQPPRDQASGASSRSSSPQPVRSRSPTSAAMAALSLDAPDDSGPSFAQMLREGKTTMPLGDAWPSVADASFTPTTTSGAWSQPRRQRQPSVRLEEESEYSFSPPAKPSFNFAEALEAATRNEKAKEQNQGRKKKKRQQRILFTGLSGDPGN
ncbi:RING finger protein 10 isoform X1 [Cimex lectularius]|uniref:E3 ubiquitin-protein ligase RNF10 n=1 Tax=Cimex lectularius TaxID=79782 RepID=A0A8I6RA91_CIMLE|nr:RING finger protein 10 isoform X1 [Cimex lectularius]